MTPSSTVQLTKRTETEEFAHSLRNIAAAIEGGLRVLDESSGDMRLVRAARAAMGRQVEHLKELADGTAGAQALHERQA